MSKARKRKKPLKAVKPPKPLTLGEVIDGGIGVLGQLPTVTDRIAALHALVTRCGHGYTLRAPGAD